MKKFIGFVILFIALVATTNTFAQCTGNKKATTSTEQGATQVIQTGDNTAKAGACQKTGAACCKNKTAQASTDQTGAATQIVQTNAAAKPACCKNPSPGCTSDKTTMSKKSKAKKAKTEKVTLTSGSSKGVSELKNNDGTR